MLWLLSFCRRIGRCESVCKDTSKGCSMYKAIKRNHILQFLIIKKRDTLSFFVCQFLPRLSPFFYWLNHTKHVQVLSWLTRDFPFFWGISGAIRGGAANITKVGFNKCQMCDMTLRQTTNAVQSFAITSVITNQDSGIQGKECLQMSCVCFKSIASKASAIIADTKKKIGDASIAQSAKVIDEIFSLLKLDISNVRSKKVVWDRWLKRVRLKAKGSSEFVVAQYLVRKPWKVSAQWSHTRREHKRKKWDRAKGKSQCKPARQLPKKFDNDNLK